MCIFSSAVKSVSETQIFARAASAASQFLVYSMSYDAPSELAMILPLPTPVATDETSVRFIDLSLYPSFFSDMNSGFPVARSKSPIALAAGRGQVLKVHEVGSFEASFVPQLADFERLDPRFRLPPNTWSKLPLYADYGFAVFRLKAGSREVHPMALEFASRNPAKLFYPTVHVHDGAVKAKAHFDHALFCQSSHTGLTWESSDVRGRGLVAREFMKMDRSAGLLDGETGVYRRRISGRHPNCDVWIEA